MNATPGVFVAYSMTSRSPDARLGWPVQGRITVGLDADLVLWDPARSWRLGHADLHSRVDFTPYEGMEVTGKPITVLVRGTQVIAGEKLQAAPGFGCFVARRPSYPASAKLPIEDSTPWLDS